MAANKHKNLSRLDTARVRPRSVPEEQSSAVVELGDMGEHIEKLKHVSSVTKKLADLLGGQLQGLSGTSPVLRGFEIVCIGSDPNIPANLNGAAGERIEEAFEGMP